jgi:hypothetical protein
MIISHKNEFIYFKTKKTAGTSTEHLLHGFCDVDNYDDVLTAVREDNRSKHRKRFFGAKRRLNAKRFREHSPPIDVLRWLGEEKFNQYFKFGNIRNPWDQAVSFYFWLDEIRNSRFYNKKKQLDTNKNDDIEGFREFLKGKEYDNNAKDYLISIEGEIVLDDVIRYENLVEDIHRICKRFKLDGPVDIIKTKHLTRPDYSRQYKEFYDKDSRELIEEMHGSIIEKYGYKF